MIKETFGYGVHLFEVEGIKMIGNSQNGSFIGLDDNGFNVVKKIQMKKIDSEYTSKDKQIVEYLKKKGYLSENNENNSSIESAYVHITDKCNLHCIGCYSYIVDRNEKKDLDFKQICNIFNELRVNGLKQVIISGGEPFTRNDFAEICKYINKLGIKVMVITNGTLDVEKYERALPYIDEISVSIDGYNEDTSFIRDRGIMPKVLETIKFLKNKISTRLIVTLHKKNIMYMDQYYNLAKELDLQFSFSILTVNSSNKVFKDYMLDNLDFEKMKEFLKRQSEVIITDTPINNFSMSCKTRCGAGRNLISIGADGSVYPCHMLHESRFKLGNILTENLKDIIFSKKNPFLDLSVDKLEGCKKCKYKYFCGGNCRARSLLEQNDLYGKDSLCEVSYSYIDSQFKQLKEMYSI